MKISLERLLVESSKLQEDGLKLRDPCHRDLYRENVLVGLCTVLLVAQGAVLFGRTCS